MSDPIVLSDRRARVRDELLAAAQALLGQQAAGAVTIRQITSVAGVPYGAFHSHFSSMDAMIRDLARLIFTSQNILVERMKHGFSGPAEVFAGVTRQTLRMVLDGPGYGRLLFDAGLPRDWLVAGMRETMRADVAKAAEWGVFRVDDVDITVSLLAGAVAGAAVDLHRGVLHRSAIEPVTARIMELLGVGPEDARRLAYAEIAFTPPPPLPLRWRDLEGILREARAG